MADTVKDGRGGSGGRIRAGRWPLALFALPVAAYLLVLAWTWDRSLTQAAAYYEFVEPAPTPSANERVFLDADAYYWLSNARAMAETGSWRVRWTRADNTPDGRPMHWSQSMTWLMVGAGWLRSLAAGGSVADNLEPAALWIQPVLLAVLAVGGAWLLRATLGLAPAVLWMLLVATSKTLFWLFHPFRPDHHSLQLLFAFGQWALLTAGGLGWVRPHASSRGRAGTGWLRAPRLPDERAARRFFVGSGLCGGLGLWVGATVGLFCTGLVVAGMLLLFWFLSDAQRAPVGRGRFTPTLWRCWGYAGGLASLAAYLVEYFPSSPLTMRLEVNHPLYALSFAASGELLARVGAWRLRVKRFSTGDVLALGLAAACAAALPLALYLGPASWHAMKLTPILRLHGFIAEFKRTDLLAGETLLRWLFEYGAVLLALPSALWLLAARGVRRTEWAWTWQALAVAGGFLYLTYMQNRWAAFWTAALFWLAACAPVFAWRPARKFRQARVGWLVVAVLLFLQPAWSGLEHVLYLQRLRAGQALSPLLTGALHREGIARALAAERHGRAWRCLASNPSLAGMLAWRAGIPAVTSFYWENLDGLNAATAFFTDAYDGRAARQLALDRGWTHVLVAGAEKMAHDFYYIRHGGYDEKAILQTFGGRLRAGPAATPAWLVPDPAFGPLERATLRFKGQLLPEDDIRIYRVAP